MVMNFSTIPDWALTDTTYKLLGDYYARLLSWYTKGAFTHELGAGVCVRYLVTIGFADHRSASPRAARFARFASLDSCSRQRESG